MIYVVLAVLGLCLGSFVNALVWRLHQQEAHAARKKKSKKQPGAKDLSILTGRSMCPNCHHPLAAKDLIPVVSWLQLRGKCRYCHKPYDDTPLAEVVTALLFVASYIWWPYDFTTMGTVNFVVWLIMLTGFVALTLYDIRWLILPNRIIYPLIVLAAVMAVLNVTVFHGGTAGVKDAVISLAIAGGLFYSLYHLSQGKWIGGGDVKLGFLIGFLIAVPIQAFLVLFVASVIGTLVVLPGLVAKKLTKTSHIPFGPFLIVAAIIVKLFGASLIAWYRHKFLFY